MAVGARLAVKGHTVTVVEQSSTYGGKLGSFTRAGFTFDTGPSLLTLPAVYRDLFAKTGGQLEDSVELVDLEPAFGYLFPDGSRVEMPGVDRVSAQPPSAMPSEAPPKQTGERSCVAPPTSGRSPGGPSWSRR